MTRPPRIFFVPGMKPKPPPDDYRRALLRTLNAGLLHARPADARLISEHDHRFTLIAWTHRFYGSYRDIALDLPGIERLIRDPNPAADDIREIESTARRVRRFSRLIGDALPFLGRLIARPALRLTLDEVWRYFSNENGIASEIRELVKTDLRRASQAGERILLIAHSLGTVIAYDALWELSQECSSGIRVDLFVTLGSPLATRVMRRQLMGADSQGAERYPSNIRRWINFAAIGEMTALQPLAPYFAPMQRFGRIESIEDHTNLYNAFRGDTGLNVHMEYAYLANPAVAECIGSWLAGG